MENNTRWFKYDRDYLCVNKPVTFPVIFEPPCIKKFNKKYVELELGYFRSGFGTRGCLLCIHE